MYSLRDVLRKECNRLKSDHSEERTTVRVHKTDNSQSIREAISSPREKQRPNYDMKDLKMFVLSQK